MQSRKVRATRQNWALPEIRVSRNQNIEHTSIVFTYDVISSHIPLTTTCWVTNHLKHNFHVHNSYTPYYTRIIPAWRYFMEALLSILLGLMLLTSLVGISYATPIVQPTQDTCPLQPPNIQNQNLQPCSPYPPHERFVHACVTFKNTSAPSLSLFLWTHVRIAGLLYVVNDQFQSVALRSPFSKVSRLSPRDPIKLGYDLSSVSDLQESYAPKSILCVWAYRSTFHSQERRIQEDTDKIVSQMITHPSYIA